MLKSVLSTQDCAQCRFCCSFRRKSLWETPLFDSTTADRLSRQFPDAKFKQLPNGSLTIDLDDKYRTDDPEEEVRELWWSGSGVRTKLECTRLEIEATAAEGESTQADEHQKTGGRLRDGRLVPTC